MEKQKLPRRLLDTLRRDPVLWISMLAALASMLLVPPSMEYLGYIDARILCLLLSLMLVVGGLRRAGIFDFLVERLLRLVKTTRSLVLVLVGLCFFSSMLITNDVALITFVPLAIMTLTGAEKTRLLIPVIVLQTIGANLGSMLTPLGNPQNLYLYGLSGMSLAQFLGVMALPSALALVLLVCCSLCFGAEEVHARSVGREPMRKLQVAVWSALFLLCILTVVRLVPYYIVLAVVLLAVLIIDRRLLKTADYGLLLTFVFFFILIGNIKSIPSVSDFLASVIVGRELTAGVLLSQIISNVPAAMLLSGFTDDLSALLLGVNLGGLGTLIASMASLISYKLYAALPGARSGRYLLIFTGANAAFLALLWAAVALWGGI